MYVDRKEATSRPANDVILPGSSRNHKGMSSNRSSSKNNSSKDRANLPPSVGRVSSLGLVMGAAEAAAAEAEAGAGAGERAGVGARSGPMGGVGAGVGSVAGARTGGAMEKRRRRGGSGSRSAEEVRAEGGGGGTGGDAIRLVGEMDISKPAYLHVRICVASFLLLALFCCSYPLPPLPPSD